jgi:excisionase family DNA binding protein
MNIDKIRKPSPLSDPLLSASQTAEALGISVGTLQNWRHSGRYPLPYVKIGGLVKYRLSAVEDFAESRTVQIHP